MPEEWDGPERRAKGSDVAGLRSAIAEMINGTAELTRRIGEMNVLLLEQSKELAAVQKKLPDLLPRSRFRSAIALVVVCGLMVASSVGFVLYLNHETTCGVRSVIVLARNAVERTPVPPEDIERVRRRDESLVFYDQALRKLKILWPCDGEDRAIGARP